MIAHEAIKLLKVDRKEFLAKYGIKSHLSKLPKELEEELFGNEKKIDETGSAETETADSAETVVVKDINVVEEVLKEMGEEPLEPKKPVVETKSKDCPYTAAEIELGIRCLGPKAPQWKWRHILDA